MGVEGLLARRGRWSVKPFEETFRGPRGLPRVSYRTWNVSTASDGRCSLPHRSPPGREEPVAQLRFCPLTSGFSHSELHQSSSDQFSMVHHPLQLGVFEVPASVGQPQVTVQPCVGEQVTLVQ
jgi:hypothetical protein